MKYVDEYRDGNRARQLAEVIAATAAPDRLYRFMEFCGGHTHAISRYGLEDLLPDNIRMIHGPGCPVCVLPAGRIDMAIALAQRPEVTLCVYGDLMRVPGSQRNSLLRAKAAGADVRMVYSTLDAIAIAEQQPAREVVFFAIGFETTTPPSAMAIRLATEKRLGNFSIFCNHVLTPPAIQAILDGVDLADPDQVALDGFVGPAHVSTVIGTRPYEYFAETFAKPVVIAGFEPLDVMQAILMLVQQVNEDRHQVENQYIRAVNRDGNQRAQAAVAEIFELRAQFEWRGLGLIPHSGLKLKPAYAGFDAECRFEMPELTAADNPACECGTILRGVKKPADCKLFGTVCTPDNPMGSCMVSSEGACAAHWTYGRFRDIQRKAS
ncbi:MULTISPECIES: hydrogenase formation protein HypD [Rhodopseudomonas]|uniref:Hydrogenase maturation factor n=1 Tax=Rhodopseudomonas palustris TaxID=1076 RepID=A0A0D7EW55_RHOPL|nr:MULTISPECIES: hydrogenase formation protein HypD [Rhodopseudomonas]KIZ45028.1 hydrogenase formation protein HupD [Rhodopseudomonas palustris]MDF3810487.1 hydrogenase formation protein HypD [Rhodopseudomonas sp. BAL398]WOK17733.1 hydrogenase formation protein HypD [Rhodopseudomonas sp. BAL398]